MVAQSSYEQAMSAIRAMEEAMREVASEARKAAERYGIKILGNNNQMSQGMVRDRSMSTLS